MELIIVVDSLELDDWGPEDNVGYGQPPILPLANVDDEKVNQQQ